MLKGSGLGCKHCLNLISLDKSESMEPKAKRLRGFKLEQEKAKGRDPLLKGDRAERPSALGTIQIVP